MRIGRTAIGGALAAILACTASHGIYAQTYVDMLHAPPRPVGLSFQLTDGTIMCQALGVLKDWYRLTPDNKGSYRNGVWSRLASLPSGYAPNAFASAVLADGRLVITGGEDNAGVKYAFTNRGAIYDPVKNLWTPLKPPAGWAYIGDSPALVLPDGKFLIGRKLDTQMALLDPATMAWTEVQHTGKVDLNSEEGWTLMPDGTVLTADVLKAPNSETYNPAKAEWTSAGSTVVDLREPGIPPIPYGNGLIYHPPGEIGPAILRPDGTVFATGAVPQGAKAAHTAVYHPTSHSWTAGPDFPTGEGAEDSFAALLPNGHVLVESEKGRLYEFDGTKLTIEPFKGQNAGMLLLPTGEVIVDGIKLYQSPGAPSPAWAPTVTTWPTTVERGGTYRISGKQFNGLSQANAVGDEFETSTNYPLVRITNAQTGNVIYARTHDHSTMGVATGSRIVFTYFDVPKATEAGPSTLVVVANGIPSALVATMVK